MLFLGLVGVLAFLFSNPLGINDQSAHYCEYEWTAPSVEILRLYCRKQCFSVDFQDMDKRKDIIRKIYDVVVKRSDKLCNFVEEKRFLCGCS